jgi:hypothetical protein
MSFRDLRLVLGRPRLGFLVEGWRRLVQGADRNVEPAGVRREPSFDMSAPAFPDGRRQSFPAEPAFDFEPSPDRARDPPPAPSGRRVNLRRPIRQPTREPAREVDFDRTTEASSHDMARRFAPSRDEPSGPAGFGLLRGRSARADRVGEGRPAGKPVWPGSVPAAAPAEPDTMAPVEEPSPLRDDQDDQLYGRAVALVRAHREASIVDLKTRLGIRLMQAAVLMDRMEREGIVGPPARNGWRRPIRERPGRTRTV